MTNSNDGLEVFKDKSVSPVSLTETMDTLSVEDPFRTRSGVPFGTRPYRCDGEDEYDSVDDGG